MQGKTTLAVTTATHRYLDWAATAPLSAAARTAMDDAADRLARGAWANPSSVHGPGRAARRAREQARAAIAAAFSVPADALIFTSGGSEALALGLHGAVSSRVLVGATEHAAVRGAVPDAHVVPVDGEGRIIADALGALLADAGRRPLVAVQHANNETGVVQDIAGLAAMVHAHGGRLLVDCVQSAGKLPLPTMADMLALSAHKLGGPAGVGALVVRCKDEFHAVQPGGGQEGGYRGGTENLIGIMGFAAAVAALPDTISAHCRALQQQLEQAVMAAGARINGAGAPRLPTISSVHLPDVPAATQLMALDMAGIAVSQGAACSSGTLKPSETLVAMGAPDAAAQSLRVSTGWGTTAEDIAAFLSAWAPMAERLRNAA